MPRMTGRGSDTRGSPTALLNGLRVLEAFSIADPVLGVTEIARRVDLHKSTVSRILATLGQAGYVERVVETGRFRLGLGVIALAGPLLADLEVRRVAHLALEQLAGRTGETAALVVWDGAGSVIVEQVPSPREVKHTANIGTRYETYESASVQIFAAQLPASEVERLLERRVLVGAYDPAALAAYAERLADVRRLGYSINDGLTSLEEVGIAAPVLDHRGVMVAGVLLSAPRFRVPPTMLAPLAQSVVDAAHEVSARLGYRP